MSVELSRAKRPPGSRRDSLAGASARAHRNLAEFASVRVRVGVRVSTVTGSACVWMLNVRLQCILLDGVQCSGVQTSSASPCFLKY